MGSSSPSGRGTSKEESGASRLAQTLDENAAYGATSMGLPQTLGISSRSAGYDTPQQMFDAYAASEATQLDGLFTYVASRGGIPALQASDYHAFASGYNGEANAASYGPLIASHVAAWNEVTADRIYK